MVLVYLSFTEESGARLCTLKTEQRGKEKWEMTSENEYWEDSQGQALDLLVLPS